MILSSITFVLSAKEVKPTLLVYGSGIEAFAAAVQAARSNVPTVWVLNGDPSFHQQPDKRISIEANDRLDSGIWKELLMRVAGVDKSSDSVAIAAKRDLNVRLLVNAMESLQSKENMLTVLQGNDVESLERARSSWRITLRNRRKYEVRAIVDASLGGDLRFRTKEPLATTSVASLRRVEDLDMGQVRTVVAIGEYDGARYGLPVRDVLSQQVENIFFVHPFISNVEDLQSIPLRAQIGQAIGASAAYCSFFKTTAEKIDVRKLQNELIGFCARLFPWSNISPDNLHFMSIQKAYLATIFGDSRHNKYAELATQDSVHTDSVRTVFNRYYSRSQLWFLDHEAGYFSLGELLSFIKILAFRGDEIDREIQSGWKTKFHFHGEYDPDRIISSYEFAVLVDRYANPFAKTVTVDGVILR